MVHSVPPAEPWPQLGSRAFRSDYERLFNKYIDRISYGPGQTQSLMNCAYLAQKLVIDGLDDLKAVETAARQREDAQTLARHSRWFVNYTEPFYESATLKGPPKYLLRPGQTVEVLEGLKLSKNKRVTKESILKVRGPDLTEGFISSVDRLTWTADGIPEERTVEVLSEQEPSNTNQLAEEIVMHAVAYYRLIRARDAAHHRGLLGEDMEAQAEAEATQEHTELCVARATLEKSWPGSLNSLPSDFRRTLQQRGRPKAEIASILATAFKKKLCKP